MGKLVIVRHGQSEWNKENKFTGWIDVDLAEKGIEEIICISVNDPFVMKAWGVQGGADGKVTMLPDGNGTFTKALGLEMDGSAFGLGERSQRFALIAEDGKVTTLAVEPGGGLEVSSAEKMLEALG